MSSTLGYNVMLFEGYATGGTGGLNPPMKLIDAERLAKLKSKEKPLGFCVVHEYPSGYVAAIYHDGIRYSKTEMWEDDGK